MNDRYDFFIVGSDQVWNPHWVNSSDVFLEFANSDKRIAYSASFGIGELPKDKEAGFKKGLEGMKHISVRENAGAEIVKKLTVCLGFFEIAKIAALYIFDKCNKSAVYIGHTDDN